MRVRFSIVFFLVLLPALGAQAVDCDDFADNDGDALIDFPTDPGCSSDIDTTETSIFVECDDGIDNDGDALIDFPTDPGCSSIIDLTETSIFLECDNGVDDDGDALIDLADPGCITGFDPTETAVGVICDDGIDNDGDGLIDLVDPGCANRLDPTETDPAVICDDGVDNDGDALIDLLDPGCANRLDSSELSSLECDDGIDNDGDSLIDLADPDCEDGLDISETPRCDNGLDDDGDGLTDLADTGCVDALDDTEVELTCISTLPLTADTRIKLGGAATFGSDSQLRVGPLVNQGINGKHWHTLIRFDDSSVPAAVTVNLATLRLYEEGGAIPSGVPAGTPSPIEVNVHRLDQSWVEASAAWTTSDGVTPWVGGPGGTYAVPPMDTTTVDVQAFGWYEWDVLSTMQEWYDGSSANHGLLLRIVPTGDMNAAHFTSRNSLATSQHPELEVCYTILPCDDGFDNDGDGLADLADPGCVDGLDPAETDPAVVCDDGVDNDADGLTDLADPGCTDRLDPSELSTIECDNGLDDDGDGFTDLADPDCVDGLDTSEFSALACDNGLDDDGDGLVDLADPGCDDSLDASELSALECDNALDDDGDGLTDLADPGCVDGLDAAETDPALICDNGLDDDGDGLSDLADPGCVDGLDTSELSALACDNGTDDDGDGLIDLGDPGCVDGLDPTETDPAVVCDDGVDNDGDGLTDLADPGCNDGFPDSELSLIACDDGIDNDGDSFIDLADPGCVGVFDASELTAGAGVDAVFSNANVAGVRDRLCVGNGIGGLVCTDVGADEDASLDLALGLIDPGPDLDAIFANGIAFPLPFVGQRNRVCLGDGAGAFSCSDVHSQARVSVGAALGEINGDSSLDAVFANFNEANSVCLNGGVGGFSCSDVSADANLSLNLALGLVDGDAHVDAVFANFAQRNRVCLGDGSGGFVCSDVSTDTAVSYRVSLGLVDNDTDLDAIFANVNSPNRVCLGDGLGGFSCSDVSTNTDFSYAVALDQVDGDGNLDAVFANAGQPDRVCLGDGAGGFTCSDVSADTNNSFAVDLGLIDGDGNRDAVFANNGQPNTVCLGDGAGGFSCSDINLDANPSVGVSLAEIAQVSEICGNGLVEGTEECDDGNTADGDCCSAVCTFQASGTGTPDCCNATGGCRAGFTCTTTCMTPAGVCGLGPDGCSCGTTNACPLLSGQYTFRQVSGGSLKVGTLPTASFPAGGTIVVDVGPGDADCVHSLVVPPGGLETPVFCIAALGFTVQVEQDTGLDCGAGFLDSNGGSDFDSVEVGDSSDAFGPCAVPHAGCAPGSDQSLRISRTIGDGTADSCAAGSQGNVFAVIPARTTVWTAGDLSCPDEDGVYDPGTDTLSSILSQRLVFTTATATTNWADLDGDGCSFVGAGPASQASATGSCINYQQRSATLVAEGPIGSSQAPLFDNSFVSVLVNTISVTGPSTGVTCSPAPLTSSGDVCIP